MSAQVLSSVSAHPWDQKSFTYEQQSEQDETSPTLRSPKTSIASRRADTRRSFARLSRSPSQSPLISPQASRKSPTAKPLSPCIGVSATLGFKSAKTVHWRDASEGKLLERVCLFSRYDEPKRCNKTSGNIFGSHLACRSRTPHDVKKQPTLGFDSSCLPPSRSELMENLRDRKVQVETVFLRNFSVCLTIRVLNIAFDKRIFIRYTTDNWQSTKDVDASFMFGGSDTLSDRFYWSFTCPTDTAKLQFAVCYQANGQEFWDNCNGENYTIASQ